MTARAVDEARDLLRDLKHEQWLDDAAAAVMIASSLVLLTPRPDLALALFAAGAFLAFRGAVATWRRWDLVDELVTEPDAYTIADVRARAVAEASAGNRRTLSSVIRWRLDRGADARVAAAATELAALADQLDDPALDFDPVCAAVCGRLLRDANASPLINDALPADDVQSRIVQIRNGFHARGGAGGDG
jgi:hypothetical protein